MSARAAFLLSLLTLGLGLFACDRLLAWNAARHFIPEARLTAALAEGPGCVVLAGDSRMVASFDEAELVRGLRESGRPDCVATVAIGALRIRGVAVALREYVARGGRPGTIVLGAAEDTLVRSAGAPDPAGFIGNEAVLLSWSEISDLERLYPDFPFGSVQSFDQGLRFLFGRTSALGTYVSLAWVKIQAGQDRLTGRARATNTFGALADMEASGRRMEAGAQGLLTQALARRDDERFDPAFDDIVELARATQAHLVVAELPMPASYRRTVTDTREGQAYLAWLRARLEARGAALVDLTHAAWLAPERFADFVHLNADGARFFSRDLGRALGGSSLDGGAPRVGKP